MNVIRLRFSTVDRLSITTKRGSLPLPQVIYSYKIMKDTLKLRDEGERLNRWPSSKFLKSQNGLNYHKEKCMYKLHYKS